MNTQVTHVKIKQVFGSLIMLEEICQEIAPFDKLDLLAKIAALQLMPENTERAIRLEAIANAITSQTPASNQPDISSNRVRQLCNSQTIAQGPIGLAEDPCDNMFTEAFTFEGGSYVVFPGILEEPTFILRNLAKALFLTQQPLSNRELKYRIKALFIAVLTLSDTIASRAGIGRGVEPISRPGGNAVVPSSKELKRLMKAVAFQNEELEQLLQLRGLSPDILEPLTVDAGAISAGDYNIGNSPLNARPIVRIGDTLVVAQPGVLLAALRHGILSIAIEGGFAREITQRYRLAVWDSMVQALDYLRLYQVKVAGRPLTQADPFLDGLFVLDTDKALYVQLMTDDLRGYSHKEVFSTWSNNETASILERRQKEVEKSVFSKTPAPKEVLVLVLIQGFGRPAVFSFADTIDPYRSLRLFMSAGDLDTIALTEGGDPLVLLKYARAQNRTRQTTSIMTSSQLDEFQLYRSRDYSYYISDETRPNSITIVPGFAGDIRREVSHKRDRHGAPAYNRGYITEVTCLHNREVPIYIPFSNIGERATILIEGLPVPVWVIGPEYRDDGQRKLHSIYAQITEMIAHWIWQCSPWLIELMSPLLAHDGLVIIELELLPSEDWSHIANDIVDTAAEIESSAIEVITEPADYRMLLKLSPSVLRSFMGADNAGERTFMGRVLQGLCEMLHKLGITPATRLDDDMIDRIVDQYIPLGMKKKLLVLPSHQVPQLDPTNLPPFRRVKHADENNLLDDLGEYLVAHGWKTEPIADYERTSFLNNHVVEHLYDRLVKLVSTLSPHGLLPWLVGCYEAITRHMVFTRLTIPTRLACFSAHGELVRSLSEELPEIHKAALATRFVIEYVAARPPNGLRPMSLDAYDQLQALASQIINWAYESDMIHYGIVDIKLSLLPSSRLGADREEYLRARSTYLPEYTTGEISRAIRSFAHYWSSLRAKDAEAVDKDSEQEMLRQKVDEASQAEFGFTLTELATLFGDIYKIGEEQTSSVKMARVGDMVHRLMASTGWTQERVVAGLELLSLGPRPDFFSPDPPFNKVDVYPWRFNRSLSYARRPLLRVENGEDSRVMWGNRHLMRSFDYLLNLCFGGTLKAQSSKMRSLIGTFHKEQGEDFNDQVAELFEVIAELVVRRRVNKIAGKRLRGPDGDVGDIDVLVADMHRRIIRVIECKDLAIARAPYEWKRELDDLFRGTKRKRSIIEKHGLRTQWVQDNLNSVLEELSIVREGHWKVEPLLVVNEEIFSPHLYPSPIKVVPFRKLSEDLIPTWFTGKQ